MISYEITIYALTFFAFLLLVKFLIHGDSKDQKVFGGVLVLLSALVSENPWAISLSIFIGGLIIASEDFMKFFAAIMRTRGDKIAETINAFQAQKIPKKEIEAKLVNEIKEISAIEKSVAENEEEMSAGTAVAEENISLQKNNYKETLPQIEKVALDKLGKSLGIEIERQINFAGLTSRFDGSTVNNEKKCLRFFEVKVFPELPKNKNGKIMIYLMRDSIRKYLFNLVPTLDNFFENTSSVKAGWDNILTVVIVLNTKTDFIRIKRHIEMLRDEFDVSVKNLKINFVFYNLQNLNLELEEK